MKFSGAFILIVLSLVITNMAEASSQCPDLSGTFSCSEGVLTITQKNQSGVTVYQTNGKTIIADGKDRATGDNPDFKGTEKYECLSQKLIKTLAMGPIASVETYSIESDGLHIYYDLMYPGQPHPSTPGQNGSQVCGRK